jgi:demethylmenaquinone methyltransferase / 2-methoxy-6-polyprenyl-1,4-benzoquinol methylase
VSLRTLHAQELFAGLPRTYERMGTLLSFGQDPRWRRFLASLVPPGSTVLDVATGTGAVAREIAARRGASIVGLDQSRPMVRQAVQAVARAGLGDRIRFVIGRAEQLPLPDETFDALTFTYLLRYVDDPAATLRELARVVRPGGTIASLEFAVPERALWRALWELYVRVGLPVAGRAISPGWREVGGFLAGSIKGFYARYPLTLLAELWQKAGIRDVHFRRLSLGGAIVTWGRRA